MSPASVADIKMAFFASPKHHVWSKFMASWGKAMETAGVGNTVIGFPGSQIGGKPPGAFKRVVKGIADGVPMGDIFIGVMPFWAAILVCAVLLIIFPEIALFLPETMIR